MELKIGDKYGCLEVIGGCEEAEVDLAPIIKQLAEKEWNKFEYNRYRILFNFYVKWKRRLIIIKIQCL